MKIAERIYTTKGRDLSLGKEIKVYNLGCGDQIYENVIGVDLLPRKGAGIVHNLDIFPWPIENESADLVVMFQTLEHLDNVVDVMNETHRILKKNGRVIIEVPYFRHEGAFQDPTHKHFFTAITMEYFCKTKKRDYAPYTDKLFTQVDFWYGWPAESKNPIIRLFKKVIKNNKRLYDSFISKIFPAKIIVYELEVVK